MKVFIGKVISTKTAKTAVVSVERIVIHPLYKKRFKRDRKYQVHDELGVVVGQMVKFTASKPYSKTKKWKVLEVVGGKNSTPIKSVSKTQKPENSKQIKVESPKLKTVKKGAKK